jgi:hypothetical protein
MRILVLSVSLLLTASLGQAAKPQPTPDVTITSYTIVSPAVVHCGPTQQIVFNVTETNLGVSATGPYHTFHFSNGVAFCFPARPSLAAGASATFTDTCTLNNGPCNCPIPTSWTIPFFGVVDALNEVPERNESNNQGPTLVQPAQCP